MASTLRRFKETADLQSLALKRLRQHQYFPIIMVVIAMLTVACLHIWQRVHVIALVDEVAQLHEVNEKLIDLASKTHTEIATLSMRTRIETYAADSLGLQLVTADRLFTLIRDEEAPVVPDRLEMILASLERVGKHIPSLTTNPVNAAEVRRVKFDSLRIGGSR